MCSPSIPWLKCWLPTWEAQAGFFILSVWLLASLFPGQMVATWCAQHHVGVDSEQGRSILPHIPWGHNTCPPSASQSMCCGTPPGEPKDVSVLAWSLCLAGCKSWNINWKLMKNLKLRVVGTQPWCCTTGELQFCCDVLVICFLHFYYLLLWIPLFKYYWQLTWKMLFFFFFTTNDVRLLWLLQTQYY